MTYQDTLSSDCHCSGNALSAAETAVNASTRMLDLADQKFGSEMVHLLSEGASGDGPLRGTVEVVGYGKEAVELAQTGDIIISRGLFPESEPHVDIVGIHKNENVTTFLDSYNEDTDFEVLRPTELVESPDFVQFLAPIARAVASPIGRAVLTGVTSGATSAGVSNALGGNSGGGSGGGGVLSTINQGISTANNALDLGARIFNVYTAISDAYDGLRFRSQPLSLTGAQVPRNVTPVTNVWKFDLLASYEPGGSDRARFPITVYVNHDCFNIIRAKVVPNHPQMNASIANRINPDRMNLTITANRNGVRNSVPAMAQFHISGNWSVGNTLSADTGERFELNINVRANGAIHVDPLRSRLVSRSRLVRLHSGPAIWRCRRHYGQLTTGQSRPTNTNLRAPLHGKHIMFTSGSSRVVERARAQVQNWWNTSLRPAHRTQISSGSLMVTVHGHADRTGSQSRNQSLSTQRANMVANIIRELAGPNVRARVFGTGEDAARNAGVPDGTNAPEWRRVTITI